jgi:hypothetical protein
VRSSTRRTILWAIALVIGLVLVGVAYVRGGDGEGSADTAPDSPSPSVPDDPGEGCGDAAATDPADLAVERTVARCGPDAPEALPLPQPATVRVALTERAEPAAPLLVAEALDEFAAENLTVQIDDMTSVDAYAALARGEVDVVVGGVDAPFFDAVDQGVGARLVLGGQVARRPSDLDTPQAGLWLRRELIDLDSDDWADLEAQTVLAPAGVDGATTYPIDTLLSQHALGANSIDLAASSSPDAVESLRSGSVGGAWLTEPAATEVAGDEALVLVATTPGSESIDGTVFGPRLLGPDRAVGVAYARAVIRTINTHLADGYGDALPVVAEAIGEDEDVVADGPAPLFDWEIRQGTMARIQDALDVVGATGYEGGIGERGLVDRSLAAEAVGVPSD